MVRWQRLRFFTRLQILWVAEILVTGPLAQLHALAAEFQSPVALPEGLRVVLENTRPLSHARRDRLPLFVLPISHALATIPSAATAKVLRDLDHRGIGYTVDWNPTAPDASVVEAMRIGQVQQRLGLLVAADATRCLQGFYDGTDQTLHVDDSGRPFADTSFVPSLGCPFALQHRVPVIADRIQTFLRAYRDAGVRLDLVFADWEIDGPIEWNEAWASSKRCRRCRDNLPRIDDFVAFQLRVRALRSDLQRRAFASPVAASFPKALVGNYAVHPHDGYRYWYDYFESDSPEAPARVDQRARYRAWAHEFEGTGYTMAMPVIYPWYRTFDWYAFRDPDYRWFYNLLLEGSSVGSQTPRRFPIVSFVHGSITAPPQNPDPRVLPFSGENYQELLWHLLLRGHDTFFLWCLPGELAHEIQLTQAVYAESLEFRTFLDRGQPVNFEVPPQPATVISGLRLGHRVLVRRTDFGDDPGEPRLTLGDGRSLNIPRHRGNQVLSLR